VFRHRFLFEQMVRRELRQKYKGSALGIAWYLVNPLDVADIPDYPVFLLAGLIVWVFFSQALLAAAPSLVLNAPLVRKVRFPRETIPASVATVQLVTFLAMLALLLPVALVVRDALDPALLLLPVVVALLFCLVLGLSLLVAVLHAHFRDVEPVLAAGLLPWFFLTPLFLPVDQFPGIGDHELIGDLLEWGNPVAPFVESFRTILWAGEAPGAGHLAYVACAGLVSLAVGTFVFRRMERDLAVVL
jgi:ABC-type polysaccharide/polyol phosphate export permease